MSVSQHAEIFPPSSQRKLGSTLIFALCVAQKQKQNGSQLSLG
ncbi:hypothetical protein J2W94_001999 [Pseudoxanthomonas sacheonensis]|uniref:Uncharacterized protein n=1 Tax=Pseudoxanthomonas sacheonensis TaxID=443615 RepID=A0ABU1RUB5_9GAMM|nr:hypothetical protein [Pseudoxanthomonas sacheonensis]